MLSDNNDYRTFPSFESIHSPTFHEICNFLPPPSVSRIRGLILHEKLLQIISMHHKTNPSEEAILFEWLYSYSMSYFNGSKLDTNAMTPAEALAHNTYHSLVLILHLSCNKNCWPEQNHEHYLTSKIDILINTLENQQIIVQGLTLIVPAIQEILHNMYTLYEIGKTTLDFCDYINSQTNSTYQSHQEIIIKLRSTAVFLVNEVVHKSFLIKNKINECGWIDRLLAIIDSELVAIVDENFMEEWAGSVIESWRDSVMGFNFFREIRS